MKTRSVIILGAGPTGLALAQQLAESGENMDVSVFERDVQVGGMARTVAWEGYGCHDLGPHKIFTTDQNLRQKVRDLLAPEDWITQPKRSRIFLGGSFLPYPPSPFSLAGVFGPWKFICMVFGFAKAKLRGSRHREPTFESDLRGRVGDSLYRILFEPIAQKLWGPPSGLDEKLSRGRVQTPSLVEVLRNAAGFRKRSDFEALEFEYPRGGLQKLWDAILARTRRSVKYELGTAVRRIEFSGNRVTRIVRAGVDDKEVAVDIGDRDFVFSTLPLSLLVRLATGLPNRLQELTAATVILNDLLLVFLHLDVPELFSDSWIFVPDPSISFHRVSEQKSFDSGMTPKGTIACCELMSHAGRAFAEKSNEELIALAAADLRRLTAKPFEVKASKVIRLPASYPVYRAGFAPRLSEVLAALDNMQNFRSIGRAGAFNYVGTLDCMDMGYGAGRWYVDSVVRNQGGDWPAERSRTSHYPVLD